MFRVRLQQRGSWEPRPCPGQAWLPSGPQAGRWVDQVVEGWGELARGWGLHRSCHPPPQHTHKVPPFVEEFNTIQRAPPEGCCVHSGWGSGERGITAAVGGKSPWPWFCGKYPPWPPGVALRPQWALGGWAKAGDRLGAEQGCVLQREEEGHGASTEPKTGASVSPCPDAHGA